MLLPSRAAASPTTIAKNYDRAIADFNEAIRIDPQSAFAYFSRGNAYSDNGDYDRAFADYDESLQLRPR